MKEKDITLRYIAKELGVSVTTVSRVLNGLGEKYRISKITEDKILKKAKSLNYSPNSIAKGLRLKKSSTIGLIVPDISNPWFAQIALGIEKEARKHHLNIFLCNSDDNLKVEKKSVSLLQNWMVDGIIIAPIGIESDHLIHAANRGVPIVLLDRIFENVDLPYITSNDFDGAIEATEYLIKMGHRHIVCVQGLVGTSPNNQRVEGYKKALINNHIAFDPKLIIGNDFGFENGYSSAKKIIATLSQTKVTAIFSVGNQITLGILKACKENGIRIPNDLSLISFDEQIYSDLLFTSLSTVSHMNENIGKHAIKMLLDQSNNSNKLKPNNIILKTNLNLRESVKKLN